MNELKTTAICSAIFGFLGLITGIVSAFFDPQRAMESIIWYSSVGVFVGVMGAPTLSPEDFRFPGTQATLSGVVAGVLVAYLATGTGLSIALGATIGGIVGFLSPIWLRYFTF